MESGGGGEKDRLRATTETSAYTGEDPTWRESQHNFSAE